MSRNPATATDFYDAPGMTAVARAADAALADALDTNHDEDAALADLLLGAAAR